MSLIACCANCGSDLENASSSISRAKTGLLSALSGLALTSLGRLAASRQRASAVPVGRWTLFPDRWSLSAKIRCLAGLVLGSLPVHGIC
jgi:hypothetical protein